MPTLLPRTDSRTVAPRRTGPLRLWQRLAMLARLWRRMNDRYRQRLDLAELDDHLRRDVGLTERQIADEIRKPPWR